MVITFCKERPSCDRVIRRAFCNLRNEIKIRNLRNGNMLMICKIEICNLQFLFCKSLAYFHFANYRFSFRFPNWSKPLKGVLAIWAHKHAGRHMVSVNNCSLQFSNWMNSLWESVSVIFLDIFCWFQTKICIGTIISGSFVNTLAVYNSWPFL